MLLRRTWFHLLLTGLLASSFLAFYFVKVEDLGLSFIFKNTSVSFKQPTDLSEENVSDESNFFSPAENLYKLYDGVETFVMFIGYQRSSHSLVAALLDAHPEIIIPHEYNLMAKLGKYQSSKLKQNNLQRYALFYDLHHLSMTQARSGIRASTNKTKPTGKITKYTYHVPGLWQGGYQNRIKVIGDKKGGHTSKILIDPNKISKLEEIRQIVRVPMKFIHVTRNPFDNISTMTLRKAHRRNAARKGVKVKAKNSLERSIAQYFALAAANQRVRERYGDAVIDIPGHETVLRPKETLKRLCDHLGVTCSEDYFEKCSKIVYGTPSVTRDTVVWSDEQIKRVTKMMKSYPFLKDYSFDKYPS